MESPGLGIYNPLLERCPTSPSPHPGLRRPSMCRKDVTLGGVPRRDPGPGLRGWGGVYAA